MDSEAVAISNAQSKIPLGKDLNGERALIAAVIALAANDAGGHAGPNAAQSARAYFSSSLYRQHMDWLGLPLSWLPQGLKSNE